MTDIERDLRAAVDERLTARLEASWTRRDGRRRRLTELSERRRYGLQQRHAGKLASVQEDEAEAE